MREKKRERGRKGEGKRELDRERVRYTGGERERESEKEETERERGGEREREKDSYSMSILINYHHLCEHDYDPLLLFHRHLSLFFNFEDVTQKLSNVSISTYSLYQGIVRFNHLNLFSQD